MRTLYLTAILASLAHPAMAEFQLGGEARLGFGETFGSDNAFVYSDSTLTFSHNGFGAALGSFGLWDQDQSNHTTYFSVFGTLPNGDAVHVGAPRGAYDFYAQSLSSQVLPILGIQRAPWSRGIATDVMLFDDTAQDIDPPLGIRYDLDRGDLKAAFSAQHLSTDDSDIYALGGSWTLTAGSYVFEGGLELVNWPDADATRIDGKAKVTYDLGRADISAAYFRNDTREIDDIAEFALEYQLTDRIKTTGLLQTNRNGDYVVGAGARYEFNAPAVVDVGVATSDDGLDAYSLSVGLQF